MNGPERPAEPEDLEPRPAFLGALREAVRREVGSNSETLPWNAGWTVRKEPSPGRGPALPSIRGMEIHHEIGRGGMGTVYRARQVGLDRLVALKLVWLGDRASTGNVLSLAKGPRAIAALSHPNIVQIFQIGKQDEWVYGVFEYVDGGSLKEALKNGPWAPEPSAALVRTLAETVHFIHQRGYIHCDLKCANVLLTATDVPKIADFGLVKLLEEGDAILQRSGVVLGTPHAMAPEQADGRASAMGPPVDVHALGVILYELLTGRPPFPGATRAEVLRQVVEAAPEPPSRLRADVPRRLDEFCLRCLQKDPSRRYADAREAADVLADFLGRTGPTREELETALDEAERSLYLSRLALAERELAGGGREAARNVLAACAPHRGRPDLRDPRWSALWDRCQGDRTNADQAGPTAPSAEDPDRSLP